MEVLLSLSLQKLPFFPSRSQNHDPKHWNSIIKHQTMLNNDHSILAAYTQMESLNILPDKITLPLILKACGRLHAIEKGKKLHNDILNLDLINDVRVQTGLVDFYCKCGCIKDAYYVFSEMLERDVVAWNALISGFVRCAEYEKAVSLVMEMQRENMKPNSVTMVALLQAFGELLEWRRGKEVHGFCLRNELLNSNAHVGTTLIAFYWGFDVRIACVVFESMELRNAVSWNVMINGYFEAGDDYMALQLFVKMLMEGIRCDSITMLVIIQACAELGSLKLGMQVHQLTIKCGFCRDLHVINALMNMYSKTENLKFACDLFEFSPSRDVALWNSMISSFVETGSLEEAMALFSKMRLEGIKEDERTIVIILPICLDLASGLKNGKSLHAHAIKSGMVRNTYLGNALLSMYTELNHAEDASKFFGDLDSCISSKSNEGSSMGALHADARIRYQTQLSHNNFYSGYL